MDTINILFKFYNQTLNSKLNISIKFYYTETKLFMSCFKDQCSLLPSINIEIGSFCNFHKTNVVKFKTATL